MDTDHFVILRLVSATVVTGWVEGKSFSTVSAPEAIISVLASVRALTGSLSRHAGELDRPPLVVYDSLGVKAMTEQNVLLVSKEGNVCTLTINRPEKRNALNTEVLIGLGDSLNALKDDPEVRVIVIRGVGEAAFSSGMDIGGGSQPSAAEGIKANPFQYAKDGITYCPKPVIAMIYGYALGGGCDLATCCDFRIAAEEATLGINPVKLGRVYRYEGIQRFIGLVGIAATRELFFTGRFITATRAKEIGLVDQVVPASELPAVTYALAREIAENAPLAVQGTKILINRLLKYQKPSPEDEAEMLALENKINESEDTREGLRAFAERRKPLFKGR